MQKKKIKGEKKKLNQLQQNNKKKKELKQALCTLSELQKKNRRR